MSLSSVDSSELQLRLERPDMDLATETKRILYVLDKTIARAKFVSVLERLISDDGFLLDDILDSEEHFYVMQVCRKYEYMGGLSEKRESIIESVVPSEAITKVTTAVSQSHKSSRTSQSVSEESEATDSEESESKKDARIMKVIERVDNELSKVILLLEENPKVRELVEELESEMSPQMKFFIKCLKELRDGVELHLGESAAQAKARENYLRECYVKNEMAKKEIESLEEELVVKKTDANACIIGKNILINRHQNKIERLQKMSLEVIEKRVKESERAMANDWKASKTLQESLQEDLNAATLKFSNLLKDHLAAEKQLRAKRTKVENQLLGWLQKFDQDIGEKQAEEEEVQGFLDEEKKQLEDIQKKLDEQEEEYDELMQEKAEYEQEVLEQKLYIFILNRSARRIQRSFRAYKARKLAKKKAKKEKKGKKGKKKAD